MQPGAGEVLLSASLTMLAALVASSALAYAPAMAPLRAARSSMVSMAVADMPGISTETGNVVWDPLKLSENMDDNNLKLVRAAELKHGRVAMLAVRAAAAAQPPPPSLPPPAARARRALARHAGENGHHPPPR